MTTKHLTDRVADALASNKATSAELGDLHRQTDARCVELDTLLKRARQAVDNAASMAEIKQARQALADLQDEERVSLKQRTDLFTARKAAAGEEAVRDFPNYQKELKEAAKKAEQALRILDGVSAVVRRAAKCRTAAKEVGQTLSFDPETVMAIADVLHTRRGTREHSELLASLGVRPIRVERERNPGVPLGTLDRRAS